MLHSGGGGNVSSNVVIDDQKRNSTSTSNIDIQKTNAEIKLETLHILLNIPLKPFPLSANQKARVIKYAFESNDEDCVNALFHRFPDIISKVDHMRFDKPGAESLRRRCIYRLLYEPPAGK